jgi:branched-chain amino acid transport system permease protein
MKRVLSNHSRLFGFILAAIIFAFVPLFIKSPYYIDLLIVTMINAALAMTFIMMLRTGLISLGIAAFWGIGAYASAMLVTQGHVSFWLSLPVSALITAAFAFIIGLIIIRNAGFTFVILTTVIGMLFVVAVGNISALNRYNGISNIPPPNTIDLPILPPIVFDSKVAFFYLGLVIFILVVLFINAFYSSWAGRAWNAIGLNPRLAQSLGVNVFRYRLLSFVLASGIAGLMGSFYAHYQTFIIPNAFNLFPKAIYFQVYAILGGIDFATLGPIVGAALLTFFPDLVSMKPEITIILVGGLMVLLIIFLPKGILSLLQYRTRIANLKNKGPSNRSSKPAEQPDEAGKV